MNTSETKKYIVYVLIVLGFDFISKYNCFSDSIGFRQFTWGGENFLKIAYIYLQELPTADFLLPRYSIFI